MGFVCSHYFDEPCIYCCISCKSHLSRNDDLKSKSFKGKFGDAFLFDQVVNVKKAEPVMKNMITGQYLVQDITCAQCGSDVGWTYVKSLEEAEKYKEGMYILEVEKICLSKRDGYVRDSVKETSRGVQSVWTFSRERL
ncbi:Protein yippee-like protein [Yarrowia sp. C11]|nr:Protein yippee-like protein [Yarrowia sp. E02]KAG5373177.1 Protein yippee-like protein [Yarrowia sp. C11]